MEKVYIDKFAIAWIFMGNLLAIVAVAVIAYLLFEMPIAVLWSYVMIGLVGHSNRKRDEHTKEYQPEKENVEKDMEKVKEASKL